jgi:hypothetical protein
LIQIDFAENYSIISQDEIQAAHWSHSRITIFTSTCVVWLLLEVTTSFAIISDHLAHNKYAVFTFLSRIIKEGQSKHKLIDNVTIFSDGCAAQFKNKYTLSNLCFMKEDHSVTLSEWNFFCYFSCSDVGNRIDGA